MPWPDSLRSLACLPALLFLPQEPSPEKAQEAQETKEFVNAAGTLRAVVRERTLGFKDPSMSEDSVVFSSDGSNLAYMVMTGKGLAVVVNGVEGESFEAIPAKSIAFSPDGSHLAYAAFREGKQYVVLDGKAFPYQTLTEHGIVFSPDGKRTAWVVEQDKKQLVVLDGEPQAAYDGIDRKGVAFSSDSSHVAYIATSAGQQCVVLDGTEGPFLESVVACWFTPDGKHVAYVARSAGKLVLFFDGAPVYEADALGKGIVFPNHGGRYAAAARVGEEWRVIVDGTTLGPYKNAFGLSFSPDGSHLAFRAGRGQGMFLVLDGVEHTEFEAYDSLAFAPEGDHLAFTARRGSRHVAVLDGKQGPEFDAIDEPGITFSADGKHASYVGQRDDQKVVVLDGRESEPFAQFGDLAPRFLGDHLIYSIRSGEHQIVASDLVPGPLFGELREPTISADGTRYAYAGERNQRWFVVVDGEEAASYPFVPESPLVSRDGGRVAYRVIREGKSFVVVDGTEGPRYEIVRAGSLTFSPAGSHLAYAAATADRRFVVIDDLVIENGYQGFQAKAGFHFTDETHATLRVGKSGRLVLLEIELLPASGSR